MSTLADDAAKHRALGKLHADVVKQAEMCAMFPELVDSLRDIRIELAQLIRFPSMPRAEDWPCVNSVDRACLQKAYEILTDQLESARKLL
jgi:hypothetical protein